MGNISGRIKYRVSRPFREYNIHERAHKAVLKNREVAAPKHPSTAKHIKRAINELPPEVKKSLRESDFGLNKRLTQVFVTSTDVKAESAENPDRPLPLNRMGHELPEYGYTDPKTVPYGKTTLRDALHFIAKHQEDKIVNSSQAIAIKYKLSHENADNILKYFGTFMLFVPKKLSPKQEDMLNSLRGDESFLPATKEVRQTLAGMSVSLPRGSLQKGQIPMTEIEAQDKGKQYHETTVQDVVFESGEEKESKPPVDEQDDTTTKVTSQQETAGKYEDPAFPDRNRPTPVRGYNELENKYLKEEEKDKPAGT